MNFALDAMVKINGSFYTDEGRNPVEVTLDERAVVNELASGRKTKYVKYKARTITVSWKMMPNAAAQAIDGNAGRSELVALLFGGTNTFTVILDDGINDAATYSCYLKDYTEKPSLRRPGAMRWEVSVTFEEVGS